MEDNVAQDLIIDYLEKSNMHNTVKVFESELDAAELAAEADDSFEQTNKSVVPPRIFNYCEADVKHQDEIRGIVGKLTSLQNSYDVSLKHAQQFYSIAVMATQKLIEEQPDSAEGKELKSVLLQYHQVFFDQPEASLDFMDVGVLGQIKTQLGEPGKTVKTLGDIRQTALHCPVEKQAALVEKLITKDILGNNLVTWLSDKSHVKKHNTIGVLSILASVPKGVQYIMDKEYEEVLRRLSGQLQVLDKDSVTIRLILTVIQKLTIENVQAAEFLIQNEFIDALIQIVESSSLRFTVNYATAILANLLQHTSSREHLLEKDLIGSMGAIFLSWLTTEFTALPYLASVLQYLGADVDCIKPLKDTGFQQKITEFLDRYRRYSVESESEKEAVVGMLEQTLRRESAKQSAHYGNVIFETFPDEVRYLND